MKGRRHKLKYKINSKIDETYLSTQNSNTNYCERYQLMVKSKTNDDKNITNM